MRPRHLLIAAPLLALVACDPGRNDVFIDYPAPVGAGGGGAGGGGSAGRSGHDGGPFKGEPAGFSGDFGGGPAAPPPVPLDLGAVKVAEPAPEPLSGGTLAVGDRDDSGHPEVAVVGDVDQRALFVVDLGTLAVKKLALDEGETPGRVVIEHGVAHVVDRGKGQILDVSLASPEITARRSVCAAPRGLAYDEKGDQLWVACQGGEVQVLPAGSGGVAQQTRLAPDLRDIVVSGDEVLVSRLRSAELEVLDRELVSQGKAKPPTLMAGDAGDVELTPSVAWRMVAAPGGGAVVVHQRGSTRPLEIKAPGGYGSTGFCPGGGVVHGAFSVVGGGKVTSSPPIAGVLPLDIAVSRNGRLAIAVGTPDSVKRFTQFAAAPCQPVSVIGGKPSSIPFSGGTSELPYKEDANADFPLPSVKPSSAQTSQAVSVAFAKNNLPVVQGRLPSALHWGDVTIPLGGEVVDDTGHRLFHLDAGSGVACASCHPEAGDDGRVWKFEGLGPRRTQSLRGGLKGSEPFHWGGDMTSFRMLTGEVFTHRMGGAEMPDGYSAALLDWLDQVPLPPEVAATDAEAVSRGEKLFVSDEVGCASCHAGERLSSNASVDVGTGGPMQVPSLRRVSLRTPLLHDGCAAGLKERFGACGGGDEHGHTSQLSPADIDDLVAYLGSL